SASLPTLQLLLSLLVRGPPRPPISPLFPYTTLFRSRWPRDDTSSPCAESPRAPACSRSWPGLPPSRPGQGSSPRIYDPQSSEDQDRKSTRLNSSHQIISYAVFCLKKKNTPGYAPKAC